MPPNQQWRPVPDWPGYEAGSRGKVRSVERELPDGRTAGGVTLTPAADADGYLFVTLSDGPRRRRVHVARLVLEAFDGPCQPGMEALHRNGKRDDTRYANLRWAARRPAAAAAMSGGAASA